MSSQIQRSIFNFALAIYRVTELLRPEEPLRHYLREQAGEALSLFMRREQGRVISNLDAIEALLEFAHQSGLVKAINAEILLREGRALAEYLRREQGLDQNDVPFLRSFFEENGLSNEKSACETPKLEDVKNIKTTSDDSINDNVVDRSGVELRVVPQPKQHDSGDASLNERQRAIIDYLRINQEAKINDLAVMFENRFSLKTLQRDMSRLITEKQVERQGDKRWAVYRLTQ